MRRLVIMLLWAAGMDAPHAADLTACFPKCNAGSTTASTDSEFEENAIVPLPEWLVAAEPPALITCASPEAAAAPQASEAGSPSQPAVAARPAAEVARKIQKRTVVATHPVRRRAAVMR
jgi:hypothetical protein